MSLINVPVEFQTSEEDKTKSTFTLVEILVQMEQTVDTGDALAVAETEKSTIEIPSPASGKVKEIFLKTGQEYVYGATLLTIERN